MLPGPIIYYECPHCQSIFDRLSGGAGVIRIKVYSDGKQNMSGPFKIPAFTKCNNCNNFIWTSELREIGNNDNIELTGPQEENKQWFESLETEDYIEAIEKKVFGNPAEELFLRTRLWWKFNDRVRKEDESLFKNEPEQQIWKSNLEIILKLLDLSDLNQKIMAAEIHRCLGNFSMCHVLMESIESPSLDPLKNQFFQKCDDKDTKVYQLNSKFNM